MLCYVVLGAYWLQHHYSGRIYAKTDHWFSAINLLFLLAIVVIPYPIRVRCFHLGTGFEPVGWVTLVVGLALIACTWMSKWFYGMRGRRLMAPRVGVATALLCVCFFLLPQPKPRYQPGEEPDEAEKSNE